MGREVGRRGDAPTSPSAGRGGRPRGGHRLAAATVPLLAAPPPPPPAGRVGGPVGRRGIQPPYRLGRHDRPHRRSVGVSPRTGGSVASTTGGGGARALGGGGYGRPPAPLPSSCSSSVGRSATEQTPPQWDGRRGDKSRQVGGPTQHPPVGCHTSRHSALAAVTMVTVAAGAAPLRSATHSGGGGASEGGVTHGGQLGRRAHHT